jgi:hypothetical protein
LLDTLTPPPPEEAEPVAAVAADVGAEDLAGPPELGDEVVAACADLVAPGWAAPLVVVEAVFFCVQAAVPASSAPASAAGNSRLARSIECDS